MDDLFAALLAVDSESVLNFFWENLRDSAGSIKWRDDEALYVASILAHYSQTSRSCASTAPCLGGLSEVFDNFILATAALQDSDLLELGGSQVLLFAGFFRDQMARRHNVKWYDQVGQSLYERAGQYSPVPKKREFFDRLSESFPQWAIVCRDLSRNLRDNRLLLKGLC